MPLPDPTTPPAGDAVPGSPSASDTSPKDTNTSQPEAAPPAKRAQSVRASSDPQSSITHMTPSSTVTGTLDNARRPAAAANSLPADLMQKAVALQKQRMGMPPVVSASPGGQASPGGFSGGVSMNLGPGGRPTAPGFQSAPAVPSVNRRPGDPLPSLSERRAMKLGGLPGGPKLSDMGGPGGPGSRPHLRDARHDSKMNDFKHYIDAEKGWITFEGAATITRTGVNFASGQKFKISLDEVTVLEELGKGNYGTVVKVRHAKPPVPRFGQGLSGFRSNHNKPGIASAPLQNPSADSTGGDGTAPTGAATTGKIMAMKEIRLELDEAKFSTILKELVILHECVSPYIIDFYGAFFQEGAVYMCIEFMDGGSIDKLYAGGIPENVLRKIAYSTAMGLKTLKDDHNIIHRDVKPTNILANSNGQIKICDFGVSGDLVASMAKTNIGCQSYMAPERISGAPGSNAGGTYSVQSDIWSLGLTIIECAMGRYPYPPEVSSTIFSQLSAIVNGDPPDMPEGYSDTARDFVRCCLNKEPAKRYTYAMLLNHPWLKPLAEAEAMSAEANEANEASDSDSDADSDSDYDVSQGVGKLYLKPVAGDEEVAAWVTKVLAERDSQGSTTASSASNKPALHAAPLGQEGPA